MRDRGVGVALCLWFGLFSSAPLPAVESPSSPVESKIWELENAYIDRLQAEDLIGLAEFWHDEFTGWPSHAARPVDRDTSSASVAALLETVHIVSSEIQPFLIRVFGDVAVAHYILHMDIETATGEKSTTLYRMTHTWLNENGQ